jgi:hypothetical protein
LSGIEFRVKWKGLAIKMDWRALVLVAVLGVCSGLFSGLMENQPSEIGIPEFKHYGFPLAWRTTQTAMADKYQYFELFVDCLFWIAVVSVIALVAKKLANE